MNSNNPLLTLPPLAFDQIVSYTPGPATRAVCSLFNEYSIDVLLRSRDAQSIIKIKQLLRALYIEHSKLTEITEEKLLKISQDPAFNALDALLATLLLARKKNIATTINIEEIKGALTVLESCTKKQFREDCNDEHLEDLLLIHLIMLRHDIDSEDLIPLLKNHLSLLIFCSSNQRNILSKLAQAFIDIIVATTSYVPSSYEEVRYYLDKESHDEKRLYYLLVLQRLVPRLTTAEHAHLQQLLIRIVSYNLTFNAQILLSFKILFTLEKQGANINGTFYSLLTLITSYAKTPAQLYKPLLNLVTNTRHMNQLDTVFEEALADNFCQKNLELVKQLLSLTHLTTRHMSFIEIIKNAFYANNMWYCIWEPLAQTSYDIIEVMLRRKPLSGEELVAMIKCVAAIRPSYQQALIDKSEIIYHLIACKLAPADVIYLWLIAETKIKDSGADIHLAMAIFRVLLAGNHVSRAKVEAALSQILDDTNLIIAHMREFAPFLQDKSAALLALILGKLAPSSEHILLYNEYMTALYYLLDYPVSAGDLHYIADRIVREYDPYVYVPCKDEKDLSILAKVANKIQDETELKKIYQFCLDSLAKQATQGVFQFNFNNRRQGCQTILLQIIFQMLRNNLSFIDIKVLTTLCIEQLTDATTHETQHVAQNMYRYLVFNRLAAPIQSKSVLTELITHVQNNVLAAELDDSNTLRPEL